MGFTYDTLNQFMVEDPNLDLLLKMYCRVEDKSATEVFVVPNEWNSVRKRIILRALRDELYPKLWAEVQANLAKSAEDFVCKECADGLAKIIDLQPWQPDKASGK